MFEYLFVFSQNVLLLKFDIRPSPNGYLRRRVIVTPDIYPCLVTWTFRALGRNHRTAGPQSSFSPRKLPPVHISTGHFKLQSDRPSPYDGFIPTVNIHWFSGQWLDLGKSVQITHHVQFTLFIITQCQYTNSLCVYHCQRSASLLLWGLFLRSVRHPNILIWYLLSVVS